MGVEAVGYGIETEAVERTGIGASGNLDAISVRVLSFVFLALLIIACAIIAMAVTVIAAPIIGAVYLIVIISKSVRASAP